ncbi:hypothetical protein PtA15_16A90 [Puccinia triticina]|uniref:RING-type domain-containing protein n=1 Tax=Puccinia triticina TaxID=208348 RepID=A0ABY7D5X3_9BASI|nr:uncharacterized protein PtA15_16A90 [Puccinia triticina]WAQ92184.1 hypothetical protein PtA15_16A90 [Puccinia triticina]
MSSSRVVILPTCSICQDDNADLDISVTTCGHAFHTKCISDWVACRPATLSGAETKCPSCNRPVRNCGLGANWQPFYKLHSLSEREISNQPVLDRTDTVRQHLKGTLEVLQGQIKAEMAERVAKSFAELGIEDIKLKLDRWERDEELHARDVEIEELKETVNKLRKNIQLLKDEKAKLRKQSLAKDKAIRDHGAYVILEQQHGALSASNATLRAQLQASVKIFDNLKRADSAYQKRCLDPVLQDHWQESKLEKDLSKLNWAALFFFMKTRPSCRTRHQHPRKAGQFKRTQVTSRLNIPEITIDQYEGPKWIDPYW